MHRADCPSLSAALSPFVDDGPYFGVDEEHDDDPHMVATAQAFAEWGREDHEPILARDARAAEAMRDLVERRP